MIKLTPRDYQESIVETAKKHNTLVVLPTGVGKTLIALLLAIHRLKEHPTSKILILAPTKPLVEQHYESFKKQLPELFADLQLFTGAVPAKQRKEIWQTAEVIFSTPQCIANDLNKYLYDLKDVSLLVIDEAHRCLKNYDYTTVSRFYKSQALNPKTLGLTASPGHEKDKIQQICKHLNIESIEVRTRDSEDVKPYLQTLEFNKIEVPFPSELLEIKTLLKQIYDKKITQLKNRNLLFPPINKISLLKLQTKLASQVSPRNFTAMIGMSLTAQAIKISHAIELLETQTLSGLKNYLDNLKLQASQKKSKGVQTLVNSPEFILAYSSVKKLIEQGIEHPKVEELKALVENQFSHTPNSKIIIFTQFRETASKISQTLNTLHGIKSEVFLGQAKKTNHPNKTTSGLNQKEQKAMLDNFRSGALNILCATSVHPKEYIIIKKDENISIQQIGEFVESFLHDNKQTKKISGYETLTGNGEKIFFAPITQVHRHNSNNNCCKVSLSSGLNALVTKDHSLFSFDKSKNFVPTKPKKNKFIALALKCPNPQKGRKIDVLHGLTEKSNNLFGTLQGLNQSKIRELKTNYQILSAIKDKKLSITELAKSTKRSYSTIINGLARLKNEKSIYQKREKKNYRNMSIITKEGIKYQKFLEWFFKNCRYSKKKYRFKLKKVINNPKYFNNFFQQKVNVNYGKTSFPRFLELNKYLARFLGFYVSEGSTRKTKFTSDIFLAARKRQMQKLMKESIEKGLKLKTRTNWRGVAIDSQIAYHLIKDLFKAGIGSYNKEVPEIIFTAPTEIKLEFLKAYTLGDGHITKNKIVLTTVSRKLVTGLVLLLRMLGIEKITLSKQKNVYRLNIFESVPFAKIKEKNKKRGKAYYSLIPQSIKSTQIYDKYKNYFGYDKKKSIKCRNNGNWKNDVCFDYIKKITKLKKQPKYVYDISVKKTENFLGGTGLINLHNSIAEEGLDIPEVSAVFFYETIPSAIRKIQRTGRTARLAPGKLFILMTKDTRDIAHHYASTAREKKMYKTLRSLKEDFKNQNKTLDDF